MKNFVRNNYGFILGVVLGLVIPIPLGLLIGSVLGGIYDRRPDWIGLQGAKPAVDAWVSNVLDSNSGNSNAR